MTTAATATNGASHRQPHGPTVAAAAPRASPKQNKEESYYRPGFLYGSFFIWISTTGGRFLAPFLEHEGNMSASAIGLTLAMQSVIGAALSSMGGTWADARERRRPGKGRVEVMAVRIGRRSIVLWLCNCY